MAHEGSPGASNGYMAISSLLIRERYFLRGDDEADSLDSLAALNQPFPRFGCAPLLLISLSPGLVHNRNLVSRTSPWEISTWIGRSRRTGVSGRAELAALLL